MEIFVKVKVIIAWSILVVAFELLVISFSIKNEKRTNGLTATEEIFSINFTVFVFAAMFYLIWWALGVI